VLKPPSSNSTPHHEGAFPRQPEGQDSEGFLRRQKFRNGGALVRPEYLSLMQEGASMKATINDQNEFLSLIGSSTSKANLDRRRSGGR